MTASIKKTIGAGTLQMSLGSLGNKAIGAVTLFLILSHLSAYQYGVVEIALSVFSSLSFFLFPGLSGVVVADIGIEKKHPHGKAAQVFKQYVIFQTVFSLIAWGIMYLAAEMLNDYFGSGGAYYLKIISLLFVFGALRASLVVSMSTALRFGTLAIYSAIEECLKLCGVLFFIVFLGKNIDGLLWSIVISQSVTPILFAPLVWKEYLRLKQISSHEPAGSFWKLLSHHGGWGAFTPYVNLLGHNTRLWIIKFLLGTEMVGLYALAHGLLGHLTALAPLNAVLTPIIPQYAHDKSRLTTLVVKGIKYQLLAYIILGFGAFLLAPKAISLFFPGYTSAMGLFKVMLVALIPTAFAVVLSSVFSALRAQKNYFFATIWKGLITAVVTFPLVSLFGAPGIAYAFVIGTTIYTINRYLVLKKIYPEMSFSWKGFFQIEEFDRVLFMMMYTKVVSALRSFVSRRT